MNIETERGAVAREIPRRLTSTIKNEKINRGKTRRGIHCPSRINPTTLNRNEKLAGIIAIKRNEIIGPSIRSNYRADPSLIACSCSKGLIFF